MATVACCRRMSACFWSGCDERRQARTRGPDPAEQRASGEATVYATSLVCRAATPETRAHVPYNIVLVDTVEGFRMMAHGDNALVIGDEVTARFAQFAGRLVPFFARTKS